MADIGRRAQTEEAVHSLSESVAPVTCDNCGCAEYVYVPTMEYDSVDEDGDDVTKYIGARKFACDRVYTDAFGWFSFCSAPIPTKESAPTAPDECDVCATVDYIDQPPPAYENARVFVCGRTFLDHSPRKHCGKVQPTPTPLLSPAIRTHTTPKPKRGFFSGVIYGLILSLALGIAFAQTFSLINIKLPWNP